MIIQCDKCGARYRLDESKISERGTKVRCTKCNSVFVVTPPEPAEIAVEEVEEAHEDVRSTDFREDISRPAEESGFFDFHKEDKEEPLPWEETGPRQSEGFEPSESGPESDEGHGPFSFDEDEKETEEAPSEDEKEENFDIDTGPPDEESPSIDEEDLDNTPQERSPFEEETGGPISFDEIDFDFGEEITESEDSELGDLFSRAQDTEPPEDHAEDHTEDQEPVRQEERIPFSIGTESEKEPGTFEAETTLEEDEAGPEHVSAPFEELPVESSEVEEREEEADEGRKGPAGMLFVLLIMVLAGAAFYLSGVADSVINSLAPPKQVEGPSELSLMIGEVEGHFLNNKNFGRLFYMETKIKNLSEEPQDIRGVRGVIYNKNGEVVATRTVSPGRILSTEDLKTLPKEEIIKHFKDASGGSIPPKGTIPIMVVFTEVPDGMAEIGIDVLR